MTPRAVLRWLVRVPRRSRLEPAPPRPAPELPGVDGAHERVRQIEAEQAQVRQIAEARLRNADATMRVLAAQAAVERRTHDRPL